MKRRNLLESEKLSKIAIGANFALAQLILAILCAYRAAYEALKGPCTQFLRG